MIRILRSLITLIMLLSLSLVGLTTVALVRKSPLNTEIRSTIKTMYLNQTAFLVSSLNLSKLLIKDAGLIAKDIQNSNDISITTNNEIKTLSVSSEISYEENENEEDILDSEMDSNSTISTNQEESLIELEQSEIELNADTKSEEKQTSESLNSTDYDFLD